MHEVSQAQIVEGQLVAANAVIGAISTLFGPSCAFTASECAGGGWIIFSDGKPYAACTEAWEVPEIMGRVMAGKFGRSFARPERAQDVTPAAPQDDTCDMAERFRAEPPPVRPPHLRPVPDEGASPDIVARAKATLSLALCVLAIGVSAVMGV